MGGDSNLFINWSETNKVQTKYGSKWMRYWVIPKDYLEGFFVFWNNSKIKLKAQGYDVSSAEEALAGYSQAQTPQQAAAKSQEKMEIDKLPFSC
jgi:hypothetical protein